MLAQQPIVIAALVLAHGIIQFGMFGMLHEAAHRTAFASAKWSEAAGWFAALAQPMTPALMRAFHFAHHRHTHDLAKDPELGGLPFMVAWPRGPLWLVTMTGIPVVIARTAWALFAATVPQGAVWDRVLPFVPPAHRRRVAWEARVLLLVHGTLMLVAALSWPPLWRLYWALLLGHAFLSWYITCEHRGLPTTGSVLARTRSLRVPATLRWLLWNMPYHAEHHAWPAVPFHALPTLHQDVREHLPHRESLLYLHWHKGRERSGEVAVDHPPKRPSMDLR